jgi:PAS domain S-box-containing protein
LEERIQYLEEVNRFTLDALEMAASLGDFQNSINNLEDFPAILEETRLKIKRLMQLPVTAFFLVDEDSNDFFLADVDPPNYHSYIQDEVDFLIENGIFSWALREIRPIIVSSKNHEKQLMLHVMSTSSRIRGMFVGLVGKETVDIHDISLSLLSIIILNSTNALESFELYKMIREIDDNLKKKDNYKNLFEAAPDGVEVLDRQGSVVDCNKTHQNQLGYSYEEVIGNHTTDFFSEPSKTVFDERFSILKEVGYAESEVELVCHDGSLIPVWRKEKAIYNGKGNFIGAVIYNRDMSLLIKTEQEKRNLESQLQRSQKLESLGMLAGGVAHDLNNVLGGIVSYPELLLMQIPEDSPLRKPIATIRKSGEKAAAIVQDLLTLARRGVTTAEVVNLNEIIEEYIKAPEHVRLQEFHPLVQFEIRLEENLQNILGNPFHLSKTIMNLVSNAAEAMPEGGTITLSTNNQYMDKPIGAYEQVEEGEYIKLTVTDSGLGIYREDLDRIFEPFYTKKVMGRSGTGLGMAIVWGIVKDHNGYIDVQSVIGKGTTISLYFPITRDKLAKDEDNRSIEDYKGNGETILVVDDVEEQRLIASQILKSLGYSITTVSSGEEAVEYMRNHSVDLLVLDMIMDPGIDGFETYKRIIEIHPEQKAIISSGFSETGRVTKAQQLGAGVYVKKPYLLEKIGLAVRNELDK